MSNSPNKTMNTSNASQTVQSNNQAAAANSIEKRRLTDVVEDQVKKMKVEVSVLEQKSSMASAASATPPKFINASSMIEPIQKTTNAIEKRSLTDVTDGQSKKMKIETPVLEQTNSMVSAASITAPKLVHGSPLMEPIQEISDEELLQYVLEFERQQNIK